MKHKIADLEGALLDAAVAKAEGSQTDWNVMGWRVENFFTPSRRWSDGGPIIERERINLGSFVNGEWEAIALSGDACEFPKNKRRGPTPLIAAMRAYVALKFGEEIELP